MPNEYRDLLQNLESQSQQTYDKAIMSLSGGALAVSFAFVKDFVPLDKAIFIWILISAWVSWGLSLATILLSHYFSILALRSAISLVDQGTKNVIPNTFDRITGILNALSGIFFVLGVLFLTIFVNVNI